MTKQFNFLEEIKTYLTINPFSIRLMNTINNLSLLLYIISISYSAINILINLFIELEYFILYTKNSQNNENFSNNFGGNNNSPNNFNNEIVTYFDNREKPNKKTCFIPDSRIISLDHDNYSEFEMWKRKNIANWIKGVNDPFLNKNFRRYEHFSDVTALVKNINLQYQVMFGREEMINHIRTNGIYSTLHWPITKNWTNIGSVSYAIYKEADDVYNENFYNIKRPDSKITEFFNKHSPFKKTTYNKNDTWDDDISANDVLCGVTNDAIKICKESVESKCIIF